MILHGFKTAKDVLIEVIGGCPKRVILLIRERFSAKVSEDDIKILYHEGLEEKLESHGVSKLDFYILLEYFHSRVLQSRIEDNTSLYVYQID
ncbi:MAG: hypothetical protein ACPL3B_02110 [Fervidobacterium sp.]